MKSDWCVNYNGCGSHETCKAGVNYVALVGGDKTGLLNTLPCFERNTIITCEHLRFPSQEELAEREKEIQQAFARMAETRTRIVDTIKERGLWKKHATGNIACSYCDKQVYYSYAGNYNGHIHAQCESNCVNWME